MQGGPKFIRSKIFWVNLWQLYYSDSTVFKFCTSMWLFSALAPALYKGCGLLAAIIFFSQINLAIVDHLYDLTDVTVMRHVCCLQYIDVVNFLSKC